MNAKIVDCRSLLWLFAWLICTPVLAGGGPGKQEFLPDTLFYPFYDGVQMIEIDYASAWERNVNWHEMTQPRALEWSMLIPRPGPNIYLFRDTNNRILKAFNTVLSPDELTGRFQNARTGQKDKRPYRYQVSAHRGRRDAYKIGPIRYFKIGEWFDGFYRIYENPGRNAESLSPPYMSAQAGYGHVGLIDSLGNIRLPVEYDEIVPLNDYLLVCKNEKCGVIDKDFEIIIPLAYDRYEVESYNLIVFYRQNHIGALFDRATDRVTEIDSLEWLGFDFIELARKEPDRYPLVPFRMKGRFGFMDSNLQVVRDAVYDYSELVFFNNLARVNREKKWGFINRRGEEVIPCRFEHAWQFHDGKANVILDGQKCCIDTLGNSYTLCMEEPRSYERAPQVSTPPGTQVFKRYNLYGLTDSTGKFLLPAIYQSIRAIGILGKTVGLVRDYVAVQRFDKWGVMDLQGNLVLPFEYDHIGNFNRQMRATVRKNDSTGMIDRSFQMLIPCKYTDLSDFGICILFYESGHRGIMDTLGHIRVPAVYDQIWFPQNGLLPVRQDERFGMIDLWGREVIPVRYEAMQSGFHDGLVLLSDNGKWGYMDSAARIIIPLVYEEANPFENEVAVVKQHGKMKLIDRKGKTLTDFDYDTIEPFRYGDGTRLVSRNGKIGFIDERGKEVIPCIYSEALAFENDRGHLLRLDGKQLWISIAN